MAFRFILRPALSVLVRTNFCSCACSQPCVVHRPLEATGQVQGLGSTPIAAASTARADWRRSPISSIAALVFLFVAFLCSSRIGAHSFQFVQRAAGPVPCAPVAALDQPPCGSATSAECTLQSACVLALPSLLDLQARRTSCCFNAPLSARCSCLFHISLRAARKLLFVRQGSAPAVASRYQAVLAVRRQQAIPISSCSSSRQDELTGALELHFGN